MDPGGYGTCPLYYSCASNTIKMYRSAEHRQIPHRPRSLFPKHVRNTPDFLVLTYS